MSNFEHIGFVSVWAGLEHQGLDIDLLKDLCGVEFYDVDFQECSPATNNTLQPIEDLVKRFSYSESFAPDVCVKSKDAGVDQVAWLVMQLNFAFEENKSTKKVSDKVKFIGVFKYEDNDM